MVTEITRAVIAVIIVLAAVIAIIFYPTSSQVILPLAGVIVGYYFKAKEAAIIAGTRKILRMNKE